MALKKEIEKEALQIGKKLKALRLKAGFTSSELFAFQHSLPRVQYWRMEKGVNCTLESLIRVIKVHKLSLEEFFKGIK